MKHLKSVKKLGRSSNHRKALLRNLAKDLLKYGRLNTTLIKAKALRPYIEKIITKAKKNTIHSRRIIQKDIQDKNILNKLFDEISPNYADRSGGYTRIIKSHLRKNDAAQMAIIELV